MKVLHLTPCLFGRDRGIIGGAERYVFELARHMARRTPVRLLSFEASPRQEQEGALEVRTLRPDFTVGCPWNPVSFRLFRELRWADVVHCHQYKICAATMAAAFCRATRRRVFATDLGGAGLDLSSYVSTDRVYHGHLHISQYSQKLSGQEGWPRSRVIYGGVAVDRFGPDPAGLRDGTVLFAGRLLPHKGIDVLIRALPRGMALRIVGQEASDRYLGLLQGLASGREVRFIRDADDAALLGYYRRALCVVLPSVYQTVYGDRTERPELLGQTLLEGMACDTPGICSDAASLPEIVRHGETGFVVPWGDADALRSRLEWLRDRPDEARRMGVAAGVDVRRRFDWDRVVSDCLAAYARAPGGKP
jgi:glycosyltransferase involved in cell wall biosynthesis